MVDDRVFAKCAARLLPLITVAFVVNFLDRTNVGFAALTMNRDLGFAPSVYGFGAGIFFVSYSVFQVPSNLMLHRLGARRWIFVILSVWGVAAAATALARDALTFYALRFLLGMFEAGFFPGAILYLTFWFPKQYLGRFTAMFMAGNVASFVIGGPVASFVLSLNGTAGLHGWQWLFILEGLPACLIGTAILKLLPDSPADASWLSVDERRFVTNRVAGEQGNKEQDLLPALIDPRVLALGLCYGGILFAIYGFGFWLPLLVHGAGFSNGATGFVTAGVYVAPIPLMVLWARRSDARDERIWHTASALLVAAIGLFAASSVNNNALLLLSLATTSTAIYSTLSPFYGVASSILTGRAMAGGFAFINMAGGLLGGFAGQYAIGILREKTGSYAVALALMGATVLLSALIVIALGRAMAARKITPALPG